MFQNIPAMLVTEETFQEEMSPLKEEAPANICFVEATLERSGTSVALYTMPDAPLNAYSMVVHLASPHWSMDLSLAALAVS